MSRNQGPHWDTGHWYFPVGVSIPSLLPFEFNIQIVSKPKFCSDFQLKCQTVRKSDTESKFELEWVSWIESVELRGHRHLTLWWNHQQNLALKVPIWTMPRVRERKGPTAVLLIFCWIVTLKSGVKIKLVWTLILDRNQNQSIQKEVTAHIWWNEST